MAADIHKLVIPSVAAHRVAVEDKVTHVCPDLHLMIEYRAVNRLGAAMDVQHRRIALFRVKVLREQHPSANCPAFTLHTDRLRNRNIFSFQHCIVEMADLRHLAGLEVCFIQFLETGVIHRNHQCLAALFRNIKFVNRTVFYNNRNRISVHRQRVQMRIAFTGGQMIQDIAVCSHLLSAAIPAVAADAAVHAVLFLADNRQLTSFGVHLIDPLVFIQAMAASLGPQHQQPSVDIDQLMCVKTGIFPNRPNLTCGNVQRIQKAVVTDRVRLKGIAEEINGIANHLKAVGLEQRIGHSFAAAICRIVHKQRAAQFVGNAATVAPEGDFVKDFIVLFLFARLVRLGPLFCRHAVIFRASGVNFAHDQPFSIPQAAQILRGKGKGECRNRFAAGHIQTVKAGKLFARLLPFFFRCRTDRREQDMGLIFPEKLSFLTDTGQLAELSVVHPESAFIAVFFFIAVRDDKHGSFAIRRIPHGRKKPVI